MPPVESVVVALATKGWPLDHLVPPGSQLGQYSATGHHLLVLHL